MRRTRIIQHVALWVVILHTAVSRGIHTAASRGIQRSASRDYPDKCRAPRCVDYVMDEEGGDCCPTCPTGENCNYEGKIIDATHNVIEYNDICVWVCRCPYQDVYEIDGRATKAECSRSCKRGLSHQ